MSFSNLAKPFFVTFIIARKLEIIAGPHQNLKWAAVEHSCIKALKKRSFRKKKEKKLKKHKTYDFFDVIYFYVIYLLQVSYFPSLIGVVKLRISDSVNLGYKDMLSRGGTLHLYQNVL